MCTMCISHVPCDSMCSFHVWCVHFMCDMFISWACANFLYIMSHSMLVMCSFHMIHVHFLYIMCHFMCVMCPFMCIMCISPVPCDYTCSVHMWPVHFMGVCSFHMYHVFISCVSQSISCARVHSACIISWFHVCHVSPVSSVDYTCIVFISHVARVHFVYISSGIAQKYVWWKQHIRTWAAF